MAAHLPARLTPAEGRRFGLTVGLAFVVLAGVARWRGGATVPVALAAGGGALMLAGLVAPGRLGPLFRGWMALAVGISKVTTPVFMAGLYFGVITPMSLVLRLFGHRPLEARLRDGSYWVPHESSSKGSMRRQY
jgi:hypothetical protein